MEDLRIALCYRAEDRDALDVYYRAVPGGLFTIHGYLRQAGFTSHLFNFTGVPWPVIEARLYDFSPRLVGVSSFTFNHFSAEGMVRAARRAVPSALCVAGGAQASFLDEEMLRRPAAPDLVVRGEGEEPFLALARSLAQGKRDWEAVPALSWLEKGVLRRTGPRPPVLDLDRYYGLERFEAFSGVDPAEQFPFLGTSRGCPARCTFCNSPRFWNTRLRFRSAGSVVEEIRYLRRRYGFDYFGFRDDTFTASRPRVLEICRALLEARIFVLWNCQSRVNLVCPERLAWMRRAGCDQIQFGVESASPAVLQRLNKALRLDQAERALALCHAAGIKTSAYFITGVPGETGADIEANRRFFQRTGLMDGVVSPLCYYPGTALFEEDQRAGRVETEIFFQDDPERWLVRRDRGARRNYAAMQEIAREAARTRRLSPADGEAQERWAGVTFAGLQARGEAWERAGDRERARRCYVELVEQWPESPWGYSSLARWLEKARRPREARGWWECARQAAFGAPVPGRPAWPEM